MNGLNLKTVLMLISLSAMPAVEAGGTPLQSDANTETADSELTGAILIEPESLPNGAAVSEIRIQAVGADGAPLRFNGPVTVSGMTRRKPQVDASVPFEPFECVADFDDGILVLNSDVADGRHISISESGLTIREGESVIATQLQPSRLSDWWRIVPPVIAILLAIVIRDVNVSLILATFAGCLLYHNFTDIPGAINQLCATLQNQLADSDHASVILFTVFLGAMIGLMNDSGGTQAVVNRMAKYANTRERGQLLTWLMGLVVFFDDYANALLIGGAMRPLSDRLRISREKLAFLIDSTAAPIAGLAVVSTWVAFEIDQIAAGLAIAGIKAEASTVFYESIPYRIYPILALAMVATIAKTGKDFGPMLSAEREAWRRAPAMNPQVQEAVVTGNMAFAVLPVVTLVGLVIVGFLNDVDSYRLLLIASFIASVIAFLLPFFWRKMSFEECSASWTRGVGSMIPAVIVLILAWAVSDVCRPDKLDTAGFIINRVGDSIRPQFLPSIAFIVAGAISLSIGSSFTTMALLTPLFIPLCWSLSTEGGVTEFSASSTVFLATVGAILAGAIFGDHCSPISDTTVLSSAASGCDHLKHVNTQFPYALLAGVFSLLTGYLPMGFGVPWWITVPLGMAVIVGAIVVLGKRPDEVGRSASDSE
ncbi:MAG: hypothetical protein KDA91_22565 [Planctomycetaceae bacterium]|nr:hypothetical protein [Planctomycetaceae bacterium]